VARGPLERLARGNGATGRPAPRSSGDGSTYRSDFVSVEPSWSWPGPAQKPHPPVLLGSESSYPLQRVVEFCAGWFPRARNAERVLSVRGPTT
jgi:alkanesulfonate monooxygenase SsuD/methylene tetrahydromethanopterin reductase-like flavin-dependent oxidoreductase (luciferase family)